MPTEDYRPQLADVAGYVAERTYDRDAVKQGTFTGSTRVTDQAAERVVDQALLDVAGQVGTDVVEEARPLVASLAALRAAMFIEASYWSTNGDNSSYERLQALYEDRLASTRAALVELAAGGEVGPGDDAQLARWHFADPDHVPIGLRTLW